MRGRKLVPIALRTAGGERKGPETQRGLGQGIGLMSLILPQVIGIGMKGVILVIPVEFLGIGLEMRKKIRFQG